MIFIKDGRSNDKVVAVAAVNRLDSIDLLSAFRDQDIAAYIRSMAAGPSPLSEGFSSLKTAPSPI